ncbi:hypothetical protein NDU88_003406 [Pleurodeles waltl]|uniref:Uncharacterized protein n=1 Tax=Pleurodeles waltl TaxID=8319 RepID=A0AAV7VFP1_PLEWA|nr:hypothetical protein NDU88_003406 [Pleurodeles waltl]
MRRAHPCAYSRNPLGSRVLPRPPGTGTGSALARCVNSAARHVLRDSLPMVAILHDLCDSHAASSTGELRIVLMVFVVIAERALCKEDKLEQPLPASESPERACLPQSISQLPNYLKI